MKKRKKKKIKKKLKLIKITPELAQLFPLPYSQGR